jgi:hypothetical protein
MYKNNLLIIDNSITSLAIKFTTSYLRIFDNVELFNAVIELQYKTLIVVTVSFTSYCQIEGIIIRSKG